MSQKVDEKKKQKRDALLDNALDLFLSKGLQETSIKDIVDKAGVAKGTFYLYFKDKYDLRNILIAHEASKVFERAVDKMAASTPLGQIDDVKDIAANGLPDLNLTPEAFADELILLIDLIIDEMQADKRLLTFISKNLSWGYFKFALTNNRLESDIDFYAIYSAMVDKYGNHIQDPEIMLFLIIELVSSTIYSCILYNEPVPVDEIKPHLNRAIRGIIKAHYIPE